MCLPSAGWKVDDEFMIVVWPLSISNGPKTRRSPGAAFSSILKPPTKLSRVAEILSVI